MLHSPQKERKWERFTVKRHKISITFFWQGTMSVRLLRSRVIGTQVQSDKASFLPLEWQTRQPWYIDTGTSTACRRCDNTRRQEVDRGIKKESSTTPDVAQQWRVIAIPSMNGETRARCWGQINLRRPAETSNSTQTRSKRFDGSFHWHLVQTT